MAGLIELWTLHVSGPHISHDIVDWSFLDSIAVMGLLLLLFFIIIIIIITLKNILLKRQFVFPFLVEGVISIGFRERNDD